MRALLLVLAVVGSTLAGAGRVYWSEETTDRIRRANDDGSAIEDVVAARDSENPGMLAVDFVQGKLYWVAFEPVFPLVPKIKRSDLDGDNVEALVGVRTEARPRGVALDLLEGKVYYADPGDCSFCGVIRRANLDGTGPETLSQSVDFPTAIAVHPTGTMWWTDLLGRIIRADLDTSNQQIIVTGTLSYGIAVDRTGDRIYWTDGPAGKIRRAHADGTAVQDLVTGLNFPFGIALDIAAEKIYWSDWGAGTIQRADLDGSRVETLISGLPSPTGIALDPEGWAERPDTP